MNISKLLKITALSCIGLFSLNNHTVNANNIVNASDDSDFDIDDSFGFDYNYNNILELYNQKKLRAILSVDDCKVDQFPENKHVLITNGHNLFDYYNGIVNVYYNIFNSDSESEIMELQSLYELKDDVINKFGAVNGLLIEEKDNKSAIMNEFGLSLIIHEVFGDTYELIDVDDYNLSDL